MILHQIIFYLVKEKKKKLYLINFGLSEKEGPYRVLIKEEVMSNKECCGTLSFSSMSSKYGKKTLIQMT